jgi:hypothetical protein
MADFLEFSWGLPSWRLLTVCLGLFTSGMRRRFGDCPLGDRPWAMSCLQCRRIFMASLLLLSDGKNL